MTDPRPVSGSFRDPSGSLYYADGILYRQVNAQYRSEYDHLVKSGLLRELFETGLLVEHEEVDLSLSATDDAYRVLRPVKIPFISYPYEWSFGQLKAAALHTLTVMRHALDRGMILKDASAYNVQFLGSRPIFVDTLSFDPYVAGQPWLAYRQFCQHFLAPLALMGHLDVRLAQLMQTNIDGIPLDLASRLLPGRAKLRPGIATHITLHAYTQRRFAQSAGTGGEGPRGRVSRMGLQGILDSLESTVRRSDCAHRATEWKDYSPEESYVEEAASNKKHLVEEFLSEAGRQGLVLDLGANKGAYSMLAARYADYVVAIDADSAASEILFTSLAAAGNTHVLPLRVDLTAPSPAIGWDNTERPALKERAGDATVMALALVHHLAITNNVPLNKVAQFLSGFARLLIVEFVPKSDPQVQRLLATRRDIFPRYTREHFEADFSVLYAIRRAVPIVASERVLYFMERRGR